MLKIIGFGIGNIFQEDATYTCGLTIIYYRSLSLCDALVSYNI